MFPACEDFLVDPHEMQGRPPLVGEETGGASGAPLTFELPHGGLSGICTLRTLFPYGGKSFAGRASGIGPTIDDRMEGRDRAMEKALEKVRAL